MALMSRNSRKPSVVRYEKRSRIKSAFDFVTRLILSVTLCVVIGFLLWFLYKRLTQGAFLPLRRVVLERQLVYADGHAVTAAVENFGRGDLLHINVQTLAEELRRLDWVKTAQVNMQWPDALRIDIQERIPILRWGDNGFLDSEAYYFELPNNPSLPELFPVFGPQGSERNVLEMYRRINPWFNRQNITLNVLILDGRQVWHLHLDNGIKVILGREDLNNRLKKLVVIQRKIISRYGQYIDTVDLRYQDGFSIRWKEGVSPIEDGQEKMGNKRL